MNLETEGRVAVSWEAYCLNRVTHSHNLRAALCDGMQLQSSDHTRNKGKYIRIITTEIW